MKNFIFINGFIIFINNIKYINNLFILKAPFFVHKILIFLFLIFRYLNKFVKPKLIFK